MIVLLIDAQSSLPLSLLYGHFHHVLHFIRTHAHTQSPIIMPTKCTTKNERMKIIIIKRPIERLGEREDRVRKKDGKSEEA